MLRLPRLSVAALLGLVLSTSALAKGEREVNLNFTVDKPTKVNLHLLSGSVDVHTWKKKAIELRGTLGPGVEQLQHTRRTTSDADLFRFNVQIRPKAEEGWAKLTLWVPEGSDLTSSSVSAPLTSDGVLGRAEVTTTSGSIKLKQNTAEVDATTVSGSVTVLGRVSRLRVKSVSGDIEAKAAGGDVVTESISGASEVRGGPFEDVEMKSVSGRIVLAGGLTSSGRYRFNSQSGSIELWLPKGTKPQLDLQSFSGSVKSDFPSAKNGPDVRANSFSGSVRVRPQ